MTEEQKNETEQYLADTIIERPYGFFVGKRYFRLYPVTLGKVYVLQRYVEQLSVNIKMLGKEVSIEALRLAKEKRKDCLSVIYIHTCKTKDEVFDVERQNETIKLIDKELSTEDVASLMIIVLSFDRTDVVMKHLGIEREQQRMRTVMDVKNKNDKNNISFGGVSIYGSFIQPLMELGFSWNEILWERSYVNLRLLLLDKMNSVYMSDDERKKIPAWVFGNGHYIKADDPKNKEKIKAMSWK